MLGLHHLHKRERVTGGLESFPSRDRMKRFLDYVMYGVGIFAPLALLPQIGLIYLEHQKDGVSVETWAFLFLFNILWILYGIVHNAKPIIISHFLFAIFNLAIVVGVLYY
jgi:uncharacterized protein with PQ loop repeat